MKAKKMFAGLMAIAMLGAGFTGCGTSENSSSSSSESKTNAESSADSKQSDNYADTITLVWYPNGSAEDYDAARNEVGRLVEQATGKKVEQKLTTDYAIAIESLSNGTAQIGCCMGAEGYIQAKNANDAVNTLFVQSGECHGLSFAIIYEKPFIGIANPRRGGSRFDSLLDTFDLKEHYVTDPSQIKERTSLFETPDYKTVGSILERERKKSLDWLKNAIFSPKKINSHCVYPVCDKRLEKEL